MCIGSNLNVPGNNSLSGSEKYDNINGPVAKSNSEGKDTKRDGKWIENYDCKEVIV